MTGSTWRTIQVFVSSTFRDMHAERDVVVDVVAELNEELAQRRCTLVPVDLRWGVDASAHADEAKRESHVLQVCLDEIARSRPFFLGFLGDRYGWMPDVVRVHRAMGDAGIDADGRPRSVTALELEVGVLADPADGPSSLILLRDPLPYDEMPDAQRAVFSDAHTDDPDAPDRVRALSDLRARLERELPDHTVRYHLDWDPVRQRPRASDALRELLLARLRAAIGAYLDEDDAGDEPDPERLELETFLEPRRDALIGRDDLVDEIVRRLTSPEPDDRDAAWNWWVPQSGRRRGPPGTLLTGNSGEGKSAVFAEVWRRVEARDDVTVLVHAAGAGPRSADAAGMIERWSVQLEGVLDRSPDTDGTALHDRFERLLTEVAAVRPVVLLIDAIDQFSPTPEARHQTYLPRRLPPGVTLLATAQRGAAAELLAERQDVVEHSLPALLESDLRRMVEEVAAVHRRKLSAPVIAALVEGRDPSPLWTRLAVDALLVLDEEDFAAASTTGSAAGEADIDALLLRTARELPRGVADAYGMRIDRAEDRFGPIPRLVVLLLSSTEGGLRSEDLLAVLGRLEPGKVDAATLARCLRSLRSMFVRRGDGRLGFLHAEAEILARRLFLESIDEGSYDAGRQLRAYVLSLPEGDPVRAQEELTVVLTEGIAPVLPGALARAHARPGGWEPLGEALERAAHRTIELLLAPLDGIIGDAPRVPRDPSGQPLDAPLSGIDRLGYSDLLLDHLVPYAVGRASPAAVQRLLDGIAEANPGDGDVLDRCLCAAAQFAAQVDDREAAAEFAAAASARIVTPAAVATAVEVARVATALTSVVGAGVGGSVQREVRGLAEPSTLLWCARRTWHDTGGDDPSSQALLDLHLAAAEVALEAAGEGGLGRATRSLDRATDLAELGHDVDALPRLLSAAASLARRRGDLALQGELARAAVEAAEEAARRDPDRRDRWWALLDLQLDAAEERVERFLAEEVDDELRSLDGLQVRSHGEDGVLLREPADIEHRSTLAPTGAPTPWSTGQLEGRARDRARRLAALHVDVGAELADDDRVAEGLGRLASLADADELPPAVRDGTGSTLRQLLRGSVPDDENESDVVAQIVTYCVLPTALLALAGWMLWMFEGAALGLLWASDRAVPLLARLDIDAEALALVEFLGGFLQGITRIGWFLLAGSLLLAGPVVAVAVAALLRVVRRLWRWRGLTQRLTRWHALAVIGVGGLVSMGVLALLASIDRLLERWLDTAPMPLLFPVGTVAVVLSTTLVAVIVSRALTRWYRVSPADHAASMALAAIGWRGSDETRAWSEVVTDPADLVRPAPPAGAARTSLFRDAWIRLHAAGGIVSIRPELADELVWGASADLDRLGGVPGTATDASARSAGDPDRRVLAARIAVWSDRRGLAGPRPDDVAANRARLAVADLPSVSTSEAVVLDVQARLEAMDALRQAQAADRTSLQREQRAHLTAELAALASDVATLVQRLPSRRSHRLGLVRQQLSTQRRDVADARGRLVETLVARVAGYTSLASLASLRRDVGSLTAQPVVLPPARRDVETSAARTSGSPEVSDGTSWARRARRALARLSVLTWLPIAALLRGGVDLARLVWRYRVELVPTMVMGLIGVAGWSWLRAPRAAAPSDAGAQFEAAMMTGELSVALVWEMLRSGLEASFRVPLWLVAAAALGLLVLTVLATACWLTPARRRDAARSRRGLVDVSSLRPGLTLRSVPDVRRSAGILTEHLGGDVDDWIDDLRSVDRVPLGLRHVDEPTRDQLAAALVSAGVDVDATEHDLTTLVHRDRVGSVAG